MSRRAPLVQIAVLVVVIGFAAGCTVGSRAIGSTVYYSDFTPAAAQRFSEFPLYWVGTRFGAWPLVAIDGPMPPDDFITFVYGTCEPRPQDDEASCGAPLEIQVQPLCTHLDVVAADPIWKSRRVRGAPVGRIDHAPVLFSRGAQIKVYTDSRPLALRVLGSLRSVNRVEPVLAAGEPIPPAPTAVLLGTQVCRRP